MTKEEFLKAFIENPESVIIDYKQRLCYNYELRSSGLRLIKADIALDKWPHYSGYEIYPVPGGVKAYYNRRLYEGEQLDCRISLAKFILKELGHD